MTARFHFDTITAAKKFYKNMKRYARNNTETCHFVWKVVWSQETRFVDFTNLGRKDDDPKPEIIAKWQQESADHLLRIRESFDSGQSSQEV